MLKMSSFENLEKFPTEFSEAVQVMVEAEHRAFADRCRIYGRPDFIEDKTKCLFLKNI